jgi:hypothetical protein
MKFFITFLIWVSSNAFAADSPTIARYQMAGGFRPSPRIEKVEIEADGSVIYSFESLADSHSPILRVVLSHLEPTALTNLKKFIAEVPTNGILVEEDPDAPNCVDAPVESVILTSKAGAELTTFRRMNCHDSRVLDDAAGVVNEVVKGQWGLRLLK